MISFTDIANARFDGVGKTEENVERCANAGRVVAKRDGPMILNSTIFIIEELPL